MPSELPILRMVVFMGAAPCCNEDYNSRGLLLQRVL
jgi:hypothetical protein